MHDKAVECHRLRNQFSEQTNENYDQHACKQLLDDIQGLALSIAKDREGTEILTEMEYKKMPTRGRGNYKMMME